MRRLWVQTPNPLTATVKSKLLLLCIDSEGKWFTGNGSLSVLHRFTHRASPWNYSKAPGDERAWFSPDGDSAALPGGGCVTPHPGIQSFSCSFKSARRHLGVMRCQNIKVSASIRVPASGSERRGNSFFLLSLSESVHDSVVIFIELPCWTMELPRRRFVLWPPGDAVEAEPALIKNYRAALCGARRLPLRNRRPAWRRGDLGGN